MDELVQICKQLHSALADEVNVICLVSKLIEQFCWHQRDRLKLVYEWVGKVFRFPLEEADFGEDLTVGFSHNLITQEYWHLIQELFIVCELLLIFRILNLPFNSVEKSIWDLVSLRKLLKCVNLAHHFLISLIEVLDQKSDHFFDSPWRSSNHDSSWSLLTSCPTQLV